MSGDLPALGTEFTPENQEYQDGYDDGFNGRAMNRLTPVYGEGYADGVEDREDGWACSRPIPDVDDWGW